MVLLFGAGINSFEGVLRTMQMAKQELGEILSSCEFIDQASLECVVSNLKLRPPIEGFPFYILLETSGNYNKNIHILNIFLKCNFYRFQ